jgi:hypothetical protein
MEEFPFRERTGGSRSRRDQAWGISRLYEQMMRRVRGTMATQFSVQTIDALFDRPVFVTTVFVRCSGIARAIAVGGPRVLQEQGTLATVRESGGRRPAILMFQELIEVAERRK